MSSGERRVFSRKFKLSAVKRMMEDGERGGALSVERGVSANQLYKWCMHFRRGGAEGLRPACCPRQVPVEFDPATDLATARKRIGDLQRKVGQQQLELDFFRQALRQVGDARRPSDGSGVPASTRSSKR
jgi:transposase-like protein